MELCYHSFSLGSVFGPGDGDFKEEVVLTLAVHPGVVALGTGIRWEVGPRVNARGSHALNRKLQTAIICRLHEWRVSMISLLTQKRRVAQLSVVEGVDPNCNRGDGRQFGVRIGAHWASRAWKGHESCCGISLQCCRVNGMFHGEEHDDVVDEMA
eukprot:1139909-Pelagomonas_calceolata.AAC.1